MDRNNLVMIISPIIIILLFVVIIFTCQMKPVDKIRLEAPFELQAQVKNNSVVLNWKWHGSSVGISGFILERKTDDQGFTGIGLTRGFSFEDWQPPLEKKHTYRVIFFQGDDKSLPSNEVEVDLVSKEVKVIPDPVVTPRPKPVITSTPFKPTSAPPRPTEAPNIASKQVYQPEPVAKTEEPGDPTPHPFEALYETVIDSPENARSGYIWFTPVASIVNKGTEFFVEVHANTGNQLLAAYGFEVVYNPDILEVNTAIGKSGVEPGKKGFVAAVNSLPQGKLLVSGFDTMGKGPNINLYLANIHFKAKKEGMTRLELTVNNMVDPLTRPIGKGLGISGTIEVIPAPQDYPIYTAMNDASSDQSTENYNDSTYNSDDSYDTDTYEDYNEDLYQPEDYYESYNTPSNYRDEPENIYDFPDEPEPTIFINTPAPEPEPTEAPRATTAPVRVTEAPRKNYPPGAGLAWFEPSSSSHSVGNTFVVEIHVNSGDSKVAAYGFQVKYDKNVIKVNTTKGQSGVEPGKDGYVAAVAATTPGVLKISGFDVAGKGPGTDLTMVKINFKADKPGSTTLDLTVMNLVDSTTQEIGNPQGKNGQVTIK